MAKTLYIIDGHAHIYAAYYAPMKQRLTSPSGEPTQATYIFTNAIFGLIQRRKPDMLVVALDSKEPTFRSDIYPEYKAQRPPMPDDMPVQINRIEDILDAMHIPMLRTPGYEADDIIGTLAKKASAKADEVYICTKDKDVLQLIDERVKVLDIKTDIEIGPDRLKEIKGVTPEQFIECLALQGDTSDNVPGVPDVGPKTALQWIQQYGTLEKLYEHADEIGGKRGENLRNNKELAFLSKELVTINCSVPVEIDYDSFALKEFDKEKLAGIFTELGFSRLMNQIGVSSSKEIGRDEKSEAPQQTDGPLFLEKVKHDYRLIDNEKKLDDFVQELKSQKLFAIDTETTSVNAMQADLVGVSFCWKKGQAYYLPVKGPMGSKHLNISSVRRKIAQVLADEKIKKVGQNIKYDLIVLRNAGLPLKGVSFDTMVASYCLDPERRTHSMDAMAEDFLNYRCVPISSLIGKGKNQLSFDMVDIAAACDYSAEDADITFKLYEYLDAQLAKRKNLKKLFEEVEMPLVSVLTEMEYNGVSLDVSLLKNMSNRISDKIDEIKERIYKEAGEVFNPDSPKQLAGILFDKIGLKSVRSGKVGRSTDAAVLEQLSGQHPIIGLIIEYRMLSKLQNTYVEKLPGLINPKTDRLHASFNQTITATGRLSSSGPNLQNIPIRTELGRQIRGAFVPHKESDCILSADYSQIELRLLAHFSKDKALLEAFDNDKDIHRFVASQVYGVSIEEVTADMRSRCKAVNFGIIYGQGPFGLSRTTGMGMAEAKKFIDDYFARYSSIDKFMDKVVEEAKKTGYSETILHRQRRISNLDSRNSTRRSQARRLAINTVIQGSAADLIKVAMINIQRRIDKENLPVKMILQIHDELVFELPRTEADRHSKWISHEMTSAIKLDVPMKVDISCGPSWLTEK